MAIQKKKVSEFPNIDVYRPVQGLTEENRDDKILEQFDGFITMGVFPQDNQTVHVAIEKLRGNTAFREWQLKNRKEGKEVTYDDWLLYMQKPALDAAGESRKLNEEIRAEEVLRQQAEERRNTAENDRCKNETDRNKAEQLRESQELTRKQTEAEREQAEQLRKEAENKRVTAENTRVNQEGKRVQAEEKREENAEVALEEVNKATNRLNELSDNRDKIIEDYWWRYNEETKEYEPTGFISKGRDFIIKGFYTTYEDLEQAVPMPEPGDAYAVGTMPPYDIYIFDSISGEWINNGVYDHTFDKMITINSTRTALFNKGMSGSAWNEGVGSVAIDIENNEFATNLLLAKRAGTDLNPVDNSGRLMALQLQNSGDTMRLYMCGDACFSTFKGGTTLFHGLLSTEGNISIGADIIVGTNTRGQVYAGKSLWSGGKRDISDGTTGGSLTWNGDLYLCSDKNPGIYFYKDNSCVATGSIIHDRENGFLINNSLTIGDGTPVAGAYALSVQGKTIIKGDLEVTGNVITNQPQNQPEVSGYNLYHALYSIGNHYAEEAEPLEITKKENPAAFIELETILTNYSEKEMLYLSGSADGDVYEYMGFSGFAVKKKMKRIEVTIHEAAGNRDHYFICYKKGRKWYGEYRKAQQVESPSANSFSGKLLNMNH